MPLGRGGVGMEWARGSHVTEGNRPAERQPRTRRDGTAGIEGHCERGLGAAAEVFGCPVCICAACSGPRLKHSDASLTLLLRTDGENFRKNPKAPRADNRRRSIYHVILKRA
ncbi:unnamed protein product [Ixodes persulcatus]